VESEKERIKGGKGNVIDLIEDHLWGGKAGKRGGERRGNQDSRLPGREVPERKRWQENKRGRR